MNKSAKHLAGLVNQILAEVERSKGNDDKLLHTKISSIISDFFNLDSAPEDRETTILLSDIRGFTSLSEQYKASEIIKLLNHYFTEMNKIIFQYGGRIDKYIGDAIMVLFGMSSNSIDSTQSAVACAVEMQIAMERVNAQNKQLGLPELFMGIGINTGPVSAGHVGSDLYQEFTVIGDGVNLASRV
ncbi:MAG: adenylate/guanylate cyclase domain-containing protein, partial [Gammaproteobacteria bacterium]